MYSLKKLGTVLHVSGSNKLIIKTGKKVKTGVRVFDEKLKTVGRVFEVFGPVKHPYISIKPEIREVERYIGCTLYTNENEAQR
ncbi:MAG: H/ACA RNA-protein complex protein Gar1 [Candidatus Bathyarchaeota archaeon]|nr:MAG: H/ACA RNA-protein complex protein Gar1 [Candidatus Bathyarchaeota archaeon]